jgi:hypothetical protein
MSSVRWVTCEANAWERVSSRPLSEGCVERRDPGLTVHTAAQLRDPLARGAEAPIFELER